MRLLKALLGGVGVVRDIRVGISVTSASLAFTTSQLTTGGNPVLANMAIVGTPEIKYCGTCSTDAAAIPGTSPTARVPQRERQWLGRSGRNLGILGYVIHF